MTSSLPDPTISGFQGTPVLGVGFGLRSRLLADTLNATHLIDWLEFTPENYMGKGGRSLDELEKAKKTYPLVSHGVSMSIGSVDSWDSNYLTQLKELFDWVDPPWFSDHLCFSGISGRYFNDLIPMPRTQESVDHVVSRLQFLQDTFQRPVLIENISYYVEYPVNAMSDGDYLTRILEQADCGLLLDVNNVYVNSINHGWEAKQYIEALPLNRVVQLHVAGHTEYPEGLVDTHGTRVKQDVWDLLDWTLARCSPSGLMLERDLYLPPFDELCPEIEQLRKLWQAHYGPLPSSWQKDKMGQSVEPLAS